MSDPDISRQIISLIKVTENIMEAYDSIKNLSSLPQAFQETKKRLPLVEQTLQNAKSPAKNLKSAEDVQALQMVLYSFDDKANKLLGIFEKLGRISRGEYDSSVYRAIIMKQGNQRVESLMDGILEDLGILVANEAFLKEMYRQIEPLAKAREELAEVSASLSDSDLADHPRTANQYGDTSRQYNLFGEGIQKIAEGHYFEAQGDQNFGMFPSKASVGTK